MTMDGRKKTLKKLYNEIRLIKDIYDNEILNLKNIIEKARKKTK